MDNYLGLIDVANIIKELQEVSSTKAKEHILLKNKDNTLFKELLRRTYDADLKYGISKTKLKEYVYDSENCKSIFGGNLFECLDTLAKSNINKKLLNETFKFLNYFSNEEVRELIKLIIGKDWKCGINLKLINKAFPGLIESFEVMKASSYDEKNSIGFNKKAEKNGYQLSIKENGIRGIVIKENGNIIIKSRQNKEFLDMNELKEALINMPDNMVLEGELLAIGHFNKSKDQFKATQEILSKDGEKKGIKIMLFDCIPLDNFNINSWKEKYKDRFNIVKEIVKDLDNDFVQTVEVLYVGKDTNVIQKELDKVSENGWKEGCIAHLLDGIYEGKRVKQVLKCKLFKTVDLRVIDVKLSKEQPDMIGSLVVKYKDNEVAVSGLKEEDKINWFKNPNEIIGKIIEIKFKEITEDKNGIESLQFPNLVRVRWEKDEESYE